MTIEPKDLNKGDRVLLRNGWQADVMGKAKGIRIMLRVYGYATEIGDTYTRDIRYRIEAANPKDGQSAFRILDTVELNDKHKKQFAAISAAGF